MLKKKILGLLVLWGCVATVQFAALAQQATAKVTVDPVEIMIGEQSVVTVEVIAPKGHTIMFPVYERDMVEGVEVIGMVRPDTLYAHDVMTLTQRYVITSFDSALYHIPYLPILDDTDTIRTNGFGLKVTSPELSDMSKSYLEEIAEAKPDSLDLEKLGVFDVKPIKEVPFVWQDYLIAALLFLFFLVAVGILITALILLRKKKEKGYFFTPKVIDPPHVVALNALNKLKEEKIWTQGREKEYYTELTDILRRYIEERFRVNAFEKTSDEILAAMNNFVEAGSSHECLQQVLKLADLVKFAKYKPLQDENDLSLVDSMLFVNQTKKEPPKPETPEGGTTAGGTDDAMAAPKIKETPKQGMDDDDEPIDWTIPDDQKLFDDDDKPINRSL